MIRLTRLTLLTSAVVLGLAAWLVADDGSSQTVMSPAVVPAEHAVLELAMAQPDTAPRPQRRPTPIAVIDTLSATMIGRCLEVAHEVDPELAARLETIRRDRSEADFRRAMGFARHLVGLAHLKQENPQLYEVKVDELQVQAQVDRVLDRIIAARRSAGPSAESEELEKELRQLVTQQVAFSLVARGMYLRSIIDHVKVLREELNEDLKPASFGPAVQKRLTELLDRIEAAVN